MNVSDKSEGQRDVRSTVHNQNERASTVPAAIPTFSMVYQAQAAIDRSIVRLSIVPRLKVYPRLQPNRNLGKAGGGGLVVQREVEDVARVGGRVETSS
jgi:hypothetical protein